MSKIKFTHISQLHKNPEPQFLVEGLIPANDITVVWGEPKSAKTFIVLDICFHVATGKPYRGRAVEQGPVAYCALEGGSAFPNRIEAARQAGLVPVDKADFWLSTDRFTFLRAWGASDLIHSIKATFPKPPKLVVIDTLNRSLSGSENTDVDMTEYTKCIEEISAEFGACVIVIHHCGVSKNKPRGHTSLTGTCAAQLKVARVNRSSDPDQPAMVCLSVEFMKDGQEGQQLFSWLQTISLGKDKKGQEVTSCYISEAPAPVGERRVGGGLGQVDKALSILQKLVEESEEGRVTLSEWRNKCRSAKIGKTKEAMKKAFYRAVERLQAENVITIRDEWVYLAKENGHDNAGQSFGASNESSPA